MAYKILKIDNQIENIKHPMNNYLMKFENILIIVLYLIID